MTFGLISNSYGGERERKTEREIEEIERERLVGPFWVRSLLLDLKFSIGQGHIAGTPCLYVIIKPLLPNWEQL